MHVGIDAFVTSSAQEILDADAVILPGVGAFGDAMKSLGELDLITPLQELAASNKPLIGICLGMQLLMTESNEFGTHNGLGIIEGSVVRLGNPNDSMGYSKGSGDTVLKVPQVGWNCVFRKNDIANPPRLGDPQPDPWCGTPLAGLADGEFMYFVHSYHAVPANPDVVLSISQYGEVEFCSSLRSRNVFACQFHPERSGPQGLQVYRNIAAALHHNKATRINADA